MRILFIYLILTFTFTQSKADFGIWASAVYLNINGSTGFYNTQKSSSLSNIGSSNFTGNIGIFGYNSGTFLLSGGEIRAFRTSSSSVCGGNLLYTVYKKENRPSNPIFSSISLQSFCACNGSNFNSCGGGTCSNILEQKIQTVNKSIDLTQLEPGEYTLELFYQISGSISNNNICTQFKTDNASGDNYKADFTIIAPLSVAFSNFNGLCTDNAIKIRWNMQNDLDIMKYEIEKSQNGFTFSSIGTLVSNNNSTSASYLFNDDHPNVGTNYYRIKMYHRNTAVTISSILRIYFGTVGNTIFIYPNPSGKELNVRFAAVNRGDYQLSVIGNNGQKIVTKPYKHDGTDRTVQINLPITLSKGLYRLFMIDRKQFFKQSFLIK